MSLFRLKKSFDQIGILAGITDSHSHLLPGVDDGMPNAEDSLKALERFEQRGIRKVWLTPHIMEEIPNRTADLKARFEEFRKTYSGPIELVLASENMLDPLFEERLKENDLLPIGKNRDRLLVETSYFSAPVNMLELLDEIKRSGFQPILAHPERYTYMKEDDYHRLKKAGIEFQINYLSFAGAYGPDAEAKSIWMLENDYPDYVGSDIHSLSMFEHYAGKKTLSSRIVRKLTETIQKRCTDL